KNTTDLLFHIILPITVIRTFITMERTPQRVQGLLLTFICAGATHLLGIVLASLSFRRRSPMERGVYRYAMVFSNAAFLALPLAQSVIGDEGVFYCSVYVGVFNVFAFTYGIYEISGRQAKITPKKLVWNPGMISVLIGVPLFLLQPSLPQMILRPMELISGVNSPLAMIVFGTFFARADYKQVFVKKEIYYVSLLKLAVIPLAMLGVFRLFGVQGNMLAALVISSSAPTATNTAMYAGKYDNDTGLASSLAVQSSVFSIATMPLIVALAMAV
ncbi:MAG: AEC family transporter, partial [Clostridiales bacterium]|nr:AEC family transporter [Clostridiales bacterium]